MWTVYSLDRTSQFVLFPPLDEAHGRWLQWFTLALHPLTVVLWNLNQIPSTPLLISKVQHSNQPMVTGPNLAKTHCWEQLSFLWVIPLMSFHFQGFINQLQWGSSWEQKFAVFEARNLCTVLSCTAIQSPSPSALQLLCQLLQAGKSASCQQDATSLRGKHTAVTPCFDYTSTWPHHLHTAFCPMLLSVKGYRLLVCPRVLLSFLVHFSSLNYVQQNLTTVSRPTDAHTKCTAFHRSCSN